VSIEPTRIYQGQDVRDLFAGTGLAAESIIAQVEGQFASAFIRAQKPTASEREHSWPEPERRESD